MAGKRFCLNGQQLVFDEEVDKYVELKKLNNKLYLEHAMNFIDEYDKVENAEDVFAITSTTGFSEIEELYMGFAEYYFEKGIYDFSESYLKNNNGEEYVMGPLNRKLDEIRKQLDDIDRRQAYEERRRSIRKESRGRFIGGGFGLSGAISGAMKAGMLNIGTGLAHSAFNAVGNAISSSNASSERNSVYEDSKDEVLDAVLEAMGRVLAVVVTQLGIETGFDFPKSESILKNVKKGIIKEPVLGKACLDGIKCDPFNEYYYAYFLENIENEKAVFEMADYFGVDLTEQKKELHEAYGVYFEDTKQAALVKKKVESIKKELEKEWDKEAVEQFMTPDYYLKSLAVDRLATAISLLDCKDEIKENDTEAVSFFTNTKKALTDIEDTVKTNFAEAEEKRKEAEKVRNHRKELLKDLSIENLAFIAGRAHGYKRGNLYFGVDEIPDKYLNQALAKYGNKMGIDGDDVIMMTAEYPFGGGEWGFLLSTEKMASSSDECVLLKDITKIYYESRTLVVDTFQKKGIQLHTFNNLEDEDFDTAKVLLNKIFDPLNAGDHFWKVVETFVETVKENRKQSSKSATTNVTEQQTSSNKVYASRDEYKKAVINFYAPSGIAYWISDYLKNNDWDMVSVYPNISTDKVQSAMEAYGNDCGVAGKMVMLQYDDTFLRSGEKGFMIAGECIVTSRKETYDLRKISSIYIDEDGVAHIKTKSGNTSEFYSTMLYNDEKERHDLNRYFQWLTNPMQMPENVFALLENGFDGPRYEETSLSSSVAKDSNSNQGSAFVLSGDVVQKSQQVKYLNYRGYSNIYIGADIPEDKVANASNTYLAGYGIAASNIWIMADQGNNGAKGFVFTDQYLLNDAGHGFAIDQIQCAFITEDLHLYVQTKDGQAYYMSDNLSVSPNEGNVINELFKAVFEPGDMTVCLGLEICETPSTARTYDNNGNTQNITAPMPGKILDIRCQNGQKIKKGDTLLVLEAMYMENEIMSPIDGKVVKMLVKKGKKVDVGDVMVVLQ